MPPISPTLISSMNSLGEVMRRGTAQQHNDKKPGRSGLFENNLLSTTYAKALMRFTIPDFRLLALFLWITLRFASLSIMETTSGNCS